MTALTSSGGGGTETWFFEEMDTRKRQYAVRSTLGQSTGGRGMLVADRIQSDDQARLIASAPALLEALRDLVEIERRDNLTDPDVTATDDWRGLVWTKARAAIASALGRGESNG